MRDDGMSEDRGGGYVIVGPLVLSFGALGAFLKGVAIFVAVIAIPIGLVLTVRETYRPTRQANRYGYERLSRLCRGMTTCGYALPLGGLVAGLPAPWLVVLGGAGIVLLLLPFGLTSTVALPSTGQR